jgi:iron(III) transport system permease protein
MLSWRLTLAVVLAALVAVPLAFPLVDVLAPGPAWAIWQDGGRLLSLASNSFLFIAGTLALTLPVGIVTAILLFRTDLPFRRVFRFLVVLALFVPVPLLVSAWQATLGTTGWLPFWEDRPGQPWTSGLGPAIFLNSLAALPWVIVLVGHGLTWVERELEEDALLLVGPVRVLWNVTLPRGKAIIAAAALWIVLQTLVDITIPDMLEVRTFAEEIYLQFSAGGEDALARSMAVSLPMVFLLWLAIIYLVPRLDRALPPLQTMAKPPLVFRLGPARGFFLTVMVLLLVFLTVVPIAGLIWKLGLQGQPQAWSPVHSLDRFAAAGQQFGWMILQSLLLAGFVGFFVAGLALMTCWAAAGNKLFRFAVLSLLALAWALPGPILGIGLKETIMRLVIQLEPDAQARPGPAKFLTTLLYHGPSFIPVIWAQSIRFLPCAVAILWPVVRMAPKELLETARLEGASPRQELTKIIWPLTARAFLWTALIVAALALGEIAASKLVQTPGADTFVNLLFDRMHNGVDNEVAALCLLLLTAVLGLVAAGFIFRKFRS